MRTKAIKSISWSAVEKLSTQAISFLVVLVLARLLGPEAFGLAAMAFVFTGLMQIFLEQGFAEAVVQRTELDHEHLNAAFWVNLLAGSLLTILGFLLSKTIAALYREPALAPVMACLSSTFLIVAFSSTQQAILMRRMDFRSLALRTLVARVSGGIVGVGGAFMGWEVWSLVAQKLVEGLVGVIVLWRTSDWRPRLSFSTRHFVDLLTFGTSITGSKLLSFFDVRLDNLLIGYFLGPTVLGYYAVAHSLLLRMIDSLTGITFPVVFSTLSRLQGEPERLLEFVYRVIQLTSLVAFPAFLGVAALSPELILTLFGPEWEPSIQVMQVLAVGGIAFSVLGLGGAIMAAAGKPDSLVKIKVFTTVFRAIGFLVAMPWGLVAIAGVVVVSGYAITGPSYIWMMKRAIRLNVRTYLSQLIVPLSSSLVMLLAMLGIKYMLGDMLSMVYQIGLYTLFGGSVYVLIIYMIEPRLLRQLIAVLFEMLPLGNLRAKRPA